MTAIILNLEPIIRMTDEQFYQLTIANPDLKLECSATGELIVMPPTGGWTGNRNIKIAARLELWAEVDGTGLAFDSSTEFNLPNGGKRSPDASWVRLDRWNALTLEEQDIFPPLCPDFVIELHSKTDSLKQLQAKIQEYLDSGLRLGWLINPQNQQVEIYRQGKDVEVLQSPTNLSGEDVLPGLMLNLNGIL